MEQTEARVLAQQISTQGTIAVAVTKDHAEGEWEKTHEWGVLVGGHWYGDEADLPEHYRKG